MPDEAREQNTFAAVVNRFGESFLAHALFCGTVRGVNALAVLALLPSTGGLIGLLVWVAIAAIVVWAIIALVKWSGIPIPQPVWIILTAFLGIFLILVLARAFGLVSL